MNSVRQGQAGEPIKFVARDDEGNAVDLSSATLLEIRFVTPVPTRGTRLCQLINDGKDGLFQYVPDAEFWSTVGTWSVQGYYELPPSSENPQGVARPLQTSKVQVLENL